MSEVVTAIPEKPRKALVALSVFRFLTAQQMVRLGVAASDTVVRDYVLGRLRRKYRPLIRTKNLSRWLPHVHYLTEHGARELAEIYRLPLEHIRFPKGKVQFGERLAKHRFAQIDFHIGLRLWAESRNDIEVVYEVQDFDVQGSRIGGNMRYPTQIDVPGSHTPIISDSLFVLEYSGHPLIYAVEVHRTTQTRAVAQQIQRYMDVLTQGALAQKLGLGAPTYICSVHSKDAVLRGAKEQLLASPHFDRFRKFFLFNMSENLGKDFSAGWHFADGTPAQPFQRAANQEQSRLLDEPTALIQPNMS